MEMSMGTIVTIVLLMSVLVLGIFLVQRIFSSGTSAIDSVDSQLQSQINELFASEGKPLVIFPASREITVKKDDDPKGFAFSVENQDGAQSQSFTYKIFASDTSFCGTLTTDQADKFILGKEGTFTLGAGNSLTNSRMVRFVIPKTVPSCPIIYQVDITGDKGQEETDQIQVTIK